MSFNFYMDDDQFSFETKDALNIIQGKAPERGKLKSFIDMYGNNIWHYLSMSEVPIKTYKKWKNKIKKEDKNHLNKKGLHFIHYLYLNGKIKEVIFFKKEFDGELIYDEKIVDLLISINADPEIINSCLNIENINYVDNKNDSPLKYITLFQNKKTLEYFLINGADPNIQDAYGKTALHYAAEIGDNEKYHILEDFYAIDSIESFNNKKTPSQIMKNNVSKNENEKLRIQKRWERDREMKMSIFS